MTFDDRVRSVSEMWRLILQFVSKSSVLIVLLWRVGGHGGIYGDQGTFWVHHHDGSVPAVRGQEEIRPSNILHHFLKYRTTNKNDYVCALKIFFYSA